MWSPQNGKIYTAILHSSKANQNKHIGGVYVMRDKRQPPFPVNLCDLASL